MRISTLFLTVVLAGLAAPPAFAQTCTTEWAAPISGSWSNDGNWTNGAPDAGDTACITAPGTYTVTLDRRQALAGLVVGGSSGLQTLVMNGTLDPLGSGTIGPNGRVENDSVENCATCDGLPLITGTLTVAGTLVHREFTGLVSEGGIVDVAPGGTLLVLTDVNNSVSIGTSDDATPSRLVIGGTLLVDEEVPAPTTQQVRVNSFLDLDGGTVSVLKGNLRVNGEGGTWTGGMFDVQEEASVSFFPTSGAANTFELSGTITGSPMGFVGFSSGSTLTAGPGGAVLDIGGTGLVVSPGSGQSTFFTSTGGTFTNTGLLTVQGNGLRLDDATLRNEADVRVYTNLIMQNGATLDNTAGSLFELVDQGRVSGGDGGQLLSSGRILASLDALSSGTSRINVPVDLDGAEVEVVGERTLDLNEGALHDIIFDVAETGQVVLTSANSNGLSGVFQTEGTFSGDVQGTVRLSQAELQSGPAGTVFDVGGNGFSLVAGSGGYARLSSAGGDFTNLQTLLVDFNGGEVRGATLRNEGLLLSDNPPIRLRDGAVVENAPGATVELQNGAGFIPEGDAPGTFVNEGLVLKTEGGTSDFRGTLRSQAGSELRVLDGLVTLQPPASEALPEGASVTGIGTVRFETGLEPEGTISPGTEDEPLATLSVFTSFRPSSQARLVIDVGEDGQSDLLTFPSVSASIELGGTLVVRLQPGYVPELGDEFLILERIANPIVFPGDFDAIEIEGDMPMGLSFVVEKPNPGAAVLRVVSGVTIEALAAQTSEDGAPVQFVVRSAQAVPDGNTLDVPLAFEGTATRYLDYVVDISGSAARIPAGEMETTVTLFPLRDDLDEATETVALRILPGGDAGPGDPDTATLALEDGPPTTETTVGGIAPSRGGNNGTVTASIFGSGLSTVTAVQLQQGGTTIEGTQLSVKEDGTGVMAQFDLSGAPLGNYDVVATAGDGTSTLANGFTVEESNEVFVWTDITGTRNPRINRWSTYTVTVGNAGNTDVFNTLVLLRLTDGIEYEVNGPLMFDLTHPDVSLPEAAEYTGMEVDFATVVPLYVYKIGAGQTADITVRIRPSAPIGIGDGAGVSVELYPPNPEATFTWTGQVADFSADLEAGTITNWALYHGAIAWAVEEAQNDPLGTRTARTGGADLNNTWNTDVYNFAVDYQTFINRYPTEPAATFTERLNLIAAFPAQAAITAFLNPVGIVVGSVVAVGLFGSPLAIVAAVGVARLGLGVLTTLTSWAVANAGGTVGGSVDPNDKLGPAGQTELGYLTTVAPARYTIRFENLETASFPAQEVVILDDLDTSVYDLSTFSLGPISLPGRVIEPPIGSKSFTTTVDLAPDLPALLVINAALDEETGRVAWTFTTLDPETNDLPEDGLIGFLPPNAEPPEGEGSVAFTIDLLPDLATNTEVANFAEIFFDLNEPIVTPVWSNRIDEDAPASSVQPIEPSDTWPITIDVESSDLGSGVLVHRLFVAEGDGPFELYATSEDPTFEFEGEEGITYGFYSIVVDNVLNTEGPKDEAEAVFALGVTNEEDLSLPREVTLGMPYPNPSHGATTLRWGLPEAGRVTVQVYDLLGREVARLADGEATLPGWHETQWQAPRLASGVYVVRLQAESGRQTVSKTQRLVIVR